MNMIMIAIFTFCLIQIYEAQSGYESCCKNKIVSGSQDLDGTYNLIQEQPHWEIPTNCSSPCIYVRESEVKELMTGPIPTTTGSSSGHEIGSEAGIDKNLAIMHAKKYCFKSSENTQSMCNAHYAPSLLYEAATDLSLTLELYDADLLLCNFVVTFDGGADQQGCGRLETLTSSASKTQGGGIFVTNLPPIGIRTCKIQEITSTCVITGFQDPLPCEKFSGGSLVPPPVSGYVLHVLRSQQENCTIQPE